MQETDQQECDTTLTNKLKSLLPAGNAARWSSSGSKSPASTTPAVRGSELTTFVNGWVSNQPSILYTDFIRLFIRLLQGIYNVCPFSFSFASQVLQIPSRYQHAHLHSYSLSFLASACNYKERETRVGISESLRVACIGWLEVPFFLKN